MTERLVQALLSHPLPQDTILNVNVPNRPAKDIRGLQATRLGFRHRSEPVVRARDPKNRPVYWVGPAGEGQDSGPGTDFYAVSAGFVSVTPIRVDLTDHEAVSEIDTWLADWQ